MEGENAPSTRPVSSASVEGSAGLPSPTRVPGGGPGGVGGVHKYLGASPALPARRRSSFMGMVSLKNRLNVQLEGGMAIIDPPLGGFDRLTIRSQLRSVKGSRRGGARAPQAPQPDVKDLMQMRQATEMVNNELQFQFRGSVSGWKLSPIRNEHKKRLRQGAVPLRPASTEPWMGYRRAERRENLTPNSIGSSASRGSTAPLAHVPKVGTVDLNDFFDEVQGSTALEPAVPVGFSLERVHQRVAHRRHEINTREQQRLAAKDMPPRPHTSMLPPPHAEGNPARGSVSQPSMPLPPMPEVGEGGGQWRAFGGVKAEDEFGSWDEETQQGGAFELYLSYVRSRSVSRQRSAASQSPSWASGRSGGKLGE